MLEKMQINFVFIICNNKVRSLTIKSWIQSHLGTVFDILELEKKLFYRFLKELFVSGCLERGIWLWCRRSQICIP